MKQSANRAKVINLNILPEDQITYETIERQDQGIAKEVATRRVHSELLADRSYAINYTPLPHRRVARVLASTSGSSMREQGVTTCQLHQLHRLQKRPAVVDDDEALRLSQQRRQTVKRLVMAYASLPSSSPVACHNDYV